jgi:polysaccharide deacetylase 2 family uncharacterized protein YibQ
MALGSPVLFAGGRTIAPEKAGLAAAEVAVESHEIHRFENTEVNRSEMKAALERLDREIDRLSERIETVAKPMHKEQLGVLKERRNELVRDFRKVNYDALVTDVQTEWRQLNHAY